MIKKIQSRFGEVEYESENTLVFPQGLAGFENLREFVVMPNKKDGPLFWIQSVEDPDVAFVLTDPTNFFLDYGVATEAEERKRLGAGPEDECFTLSVVTVHPDRRVTLNLAAPILFCPKTNRAIQVILENSPYQTQQPLPTGQQG